MHRFLIAAILSMSWACGPNTTTGGSDVGTDGSITCADGTQRCDGDTLEECSDDSFEPVQECANACDPTFGCVTCRPGSGTCNGDVSRACKADGSGYEEVFCDPVQGMSCDVDTGRCVGACSPDELGRSYIGCDYYPTVTAQLVGTSFPYAVVIANTSNLEANVTVEGGTLASARTFQVPGQSVHIEELPWVESLKICTTTATANCDSTPTAQAHVEEASAYHLRSDQPVTVYQFSPLDYTDGSGFTYSNDASLLLPSNALTGNYVVSAWPFWAEYSFPGFTAITAVQDGTEVSVTSAVTVTGAGDTPTFTADTPATVTLNQGDVLQLMNPSGDLTGSMVQASKPVQTIAGHMCTNVPFEMVACDHLEESMFPVETLSKEYIITAPAVPPLPDGKEEIIRVIATAPDTTLSIEPEITGVEMNLAAPGDFVEIPRQEGDYVIRADQKILVAQYMEGQSAGGNTGDPAMALSVATDQYRTNYLFHAPTNYEVNYVNVTALTGETVMLDGEPVTDFTPIGSSGYGVARVELTNGPADDGNHTATGSEPFGISVYGYGQYTSYWYPGGLDLANIPVE